MKRAIFIILTVFLVFVAGVIIIKPVNIWSTDVFLGGEDHHGRISAFNIRVHYSLSSAKPKTAKIKNQCQRKK